MTIREVIRDVTADGRVTGDEWGSRLKPLLVDLPSRAGDDARALLDLWASDRLQIDDIDRMEMGKSLGLFGYDVSRSRPQGLSTGALVDAVKRTNITERDAELDRLSAATGRTSNEVTVGVIDSGFHTAHAAFEGKLWENPQEIAGDEIDNDGNGLVDDVNGWDFHEGDAGLRGSPHGTHVLGIATRGTDRLNAIVSRTHGPDGMDGAKVASAIEYAAAHGARLINMSFLVDTADTLQPVLQAIARHPEVLFVKSAGNDGANDPDGALPGGRGDLHRYDPTAYLTRQQLPNLAVISGADPDGTISKSSCYGAPFSTHAARGTQVMSAIDGNWYSPQSGTSMAAPNFSSVAGKLLLLDDALTPPQLSAILAQTSDRSDHWRELTAAGGVINGDRAMRAAALTGLIRRGQSAEAAADQIGLVGEERAALMSLAAQVLG